MRNFLWILKVLLDGFVENLKYRRMDHPTALPYDLASGEAARLLGVAQSTLTRWAEAGSISGLKTPGGHWRFRRSDIQAFITARATEASS